MTSTIQLISPDIAEQWLAKRLAEARVNKGAVKTAKSLFQSGRWHPTHQGVVFDTKGRLIHGAELLIALVETGVSAELKVTRGENPENIYFYGRGQPRNSRDILKVVCRSANGVTEAPVLNALIMYAMGERIQDPLAVQRAHELFSEAVDEVNTIRPVMDGVPFWRAGLKAAIALALCGHGHKGQVRLFADELLDRKPASRPVLRFRRNLSEEYHKLSPRDLFNRTLAAVAGFCGLEELKDDSAALAYFLQRVGHAGAVAEVAS